MTTKSTAIDATLTFRLSVATLLLSILAAFGSGCGDAGTVGAQPPSSPAERIADDSLQGATLVAGSRTEAWDAHFMRGDKVGHERCVTRRFRKGDRTLIQTAAVTKLTIRRFGQIVEQTIDLTSVETADGELLSFESRVSVGGQPIVATGRVAGNKLIINTTTRAKTQQARMDWPPGTRGFFGVEQSLAEKPLQPGQERQLQTLVAVFNIVGDVHLKAAGYERTKLSGGLYRLLKIDATTKLAGTTIESILWTDRTGTVLKTEVPSLGSMSMRTTKAAALGRSKPADFDLGLDSMVKIDRTLEHPHRTQRIIYRAKLTDGDPAAVFPTGVSQRVKSLDQDTALITVLAVRPDQPREVAGAVRPPGKEDLAANNLIQSDDDRIVKLADRIAPAESAPWKIAVAADSHDHRAIRSKNFSVAFASAAEVARTLEGDCTEHAVLLAAILRARKIPARVAIGLVHYRGGFAYHMWTEAWIKDRWVPLDATLGHGGIGGGHLKLADATLAGASAYSAFLPVVRVLGRLELKVVKVER